MNRPTPPSKNLKPNLNEVGGKGVGGVRGDGFVGGGERSAGDGGGGSGGIGGNVGGGVGNGGGGYGVVGGGIYANEDGRRFRGSIRRMTMTLQRVGTFFRSRSTTMGNNRS